MSDFLVVMVTALLSGGFAIPLGFLLKMPMLSIYLAAVAGAVIGMLVFAFIGGGLRSWMMKRMRNPEDAHEKVSKVLGQWGTQGLGLIGPIFPGVTVSVVIGLAAGIDRNELVKWMTIGIFVLYALYTIGLAVLIEVTHI